MSKFSYFLVIVCFFQVVALYSQEKSPYSKKDVIDTPIIDIIPKEIAIEKDTSNFVVKNVEVLNRGIGVLSIQSVSGSCSCSNGVIEKNDVRFLDEGKLRLEINKEGLKNNDDTVIFTVVSNAKNSPFFIKVKFVEKN